MHNFNNILLDIFISKLSLLQYDRLLIRLMTLNDFALLVEFSSRNIIGPIYGLMRPRLLNLNFRFGPVAVLI
jgi:hypothetical protein